MSQIVTGGLLGLLTRPVAFALCGEMAIATKGDQIVLPAGQKLKVTLDGPVTIQTKSGVTS